jgi:hypothetical protein
VHAFCLCNLPIGLQEAFRGLCLCRPVVPDAELSGTTCNVSGAYASFSPNRKLPFLLSTHCMANRIHTDSRAHGDSHRRNAGFCKKSSEVVALWRRLRRLAWRYQRRARICSTSFKRRILRARRNLFGLSCCRLCDIHPKTGERRSSFQREPLRWPRDCRVSKCAPLTVQRRP